MIDNLRPGWCPLLAHLLKAVVLRLPTGLLQAQKTLSAAPYPLTVYLVPDTHGAVSGWLVDFDAERSHVLNNFLMGEEDRPLP